MDIMHPVMAAALAPFMPKASHHIPEVRNDHFEPETFKSGFDIPCCWCKHRHGSDTQDPCSSCGHNANSEG